MSPEQKRFDALRATLLAQPGISSARAFNSESLQTGGKIFAMFKDDALVLKLPADRVAALKASGEGRDFGSGGRVMRERVSVDAGTGEDWATLAAEALAFTKTA